MAAGSTRALAGCLPHRAAPCPGPAAAAGLSLIICSMGRCNVIYPLPAQTRKAGIAQAARPVLPGMFRRQAHFVGHLCSMEHPQRHAQAGAFRPHKGLVPVGALPAQTVVHMAGRKRIAEPRLQLPQQEQQRHAVRAAGDCAARCCDAPGCKSPSRMQKSSTRARIAVSISV